MSCALALSTQLDAKHQLPPRPRTHKRTRCFPPSSCATLSNFRARCLSADWRLNGRPLQTSTGRSITKSCNVEDVHVAETENEAANEFLGVRFNAAKIRKYSAELEVGGRVVVCGDFCTPVDAAKTYDKLVASHGDETTPCNFSKREQRCGAEGGAMRKTI
ncbi:hypothetical protein PF008_g24616 [Phytophthora fragariae]|uniref:AP2/ERF domain-containing protein n=1 Tax=Phytophthora fragariae TaxID=53985 RepID=A0A6G0QMD5_9STRA|nr:hypothetical protein PF008_g24616 [Phytophthora fragariae]